MNAPNDGEFVVNTAKLTYLFDLFLDLPFSGGCFYGVKIEGSNLRGQI